MKKVLLWALIGALVPGAVAGQDAGPPVPLTLDGAILRVLENHPGLRVADYEARAMAARMRHALLAPADRLNFGLEDFAGTGVAQDVRGIQATLSLSRTLELGGKAQRRGDVVESEAMLLRTRRDVERLDILAETARRFVEVVADQERLRIAGEALELAGRNEDAVRSRVEAGKAPATEVERITIELANLRLELDHRRHELEGARLALATLWNSTRADFGSAGAELYAIEFLPPFEELAALLEETPDLLRHARAEDLARARLRMEQSRRSPDVEINAGIRYLGSGDDMAFVVSASVPLGTAGRARHGIEEMEAAAAMEPLNQQQQRLDLHATLFQFHQEARHSADAVAMLRNTVIPASERMQSGVEAGFKAGRYSLLELLQAQQVLRDARARAIEMAVACHLHRIEIDRLTGGQFQQRAHP